MMTWQTPVGGSGEVLLMGMQSQSTAMGTFMLLDRIQLKVMPLLLCLTPMATYKGMKSSIGSDNYYGNAITVDSSGRVYALAIPLRVMPLLQCSASINLEPTVGWTNIFGWATVIARMRSG